jgi:gp16 family phage-associated protein
MKVRNALPKPSEVRDQFREDGATVADWADAHGFSRESVYAVLSGRAKGDRGKAHEIAVALGLKRSRTANTSEMTGTFASSIPSAGSLRR